MDTNTGSNWLTQAQIGEVADPGMARRWTLAANGIMGKWARWGGRCPKTENTDGCTARVTAYCDRWYRGWGMWWRSAESGWWLAEKRSERGLYTTECSVVAGGNCSHGVLVVGLKISASARRSFWDIRIHRRWLGQCRWQWWVWTNTLPRDGHDRIFTVAGGGPRSCRQRTKLLVTIMVEIKKSMEMFEI